LIEGAIIADALTTPYHAVVNRGQVRPGDSVVVVGAGHRAEHRQMATAVGARVVAVDVAEDKLAWAAGWAPRKPSMRRRSTAWTGVRHAMGGGADVAFEAVGRPRRRSRPWPVEDRGRLVLVGYSPETMGLNAAG
jgi:threonine dehydrogenase-like Zn-dependent dehydrogenase